MRGYVSMAEWKDYQSIYTYIVDKIYPENITKDEKHRIREKSCFDGIRRMKMVLTSCSSL